MGYGIFRIAKIKASDGGELMGRLKHSARMFEGYENENTKENLYSKKSAYQAFQKYKILTDGCKKRTDSVGSFEVVFTSTKRNDWKKSDYDKYLNDCIKFAKDSFGAENCFYIAKHFDEKVPHIHMFFTPLERKQIKKKQTKEEKEKGIYRTEWVTHLNAKRFFNGKKSLVEWQNKFYDQVSKKYGFDRGTPAEQTNRKTQRPQLNYDKAKIDYQKDFLNQAEKFADDFMLKHNLTLEDLQNEKKAKNILAFINTNKKIWFGKDQFFDKLINMDFDKLADLIEIAKKKGCKNLAEYLRGDRKSTNEAINQMRNSHHHR